MQEPARYETRSQLAARTGLSSRTLEKLACEGGGPPFIKMGRRVAYPVAEADAWMRARLVHSTSEKVAA